MEWLRNIRIRQKLMGAFILVAIVASLSGIVCILATWNVNTRYHSTLENYGFAQGDIGKAALALTRLNGEARNSVNSLDTQRHNASVENYQSYRQEILTHLQTIESLMQTQEEQQLISQIRQELDDYLVVVDDVVERGGSLDPTQISALQKEMEEELQPRFEALYKEFSDLMDSKATVGHAMTDAVNSMAIWSIVTAIVLIVVAILISLTLGVCISRGISAPLRACSERLKLLSQGNLSAPVPQINRKDEVGELVDSTSKIVDSLNMMVTDIGTLLKEMADGNFDVQSQNREAYVGDFFALIISLRAIRDHLNDTMLQINNSADQVASGSNQVSDGAQALSQGATQQAASVQELAATINEISEHIQNNADNAKNASQQVSQVGQTIYDSNDQMRQMAGAMEDIKNSSAEIEKIIKTIEDIAFQTNILALNAAVEAARAGAAGKGFAVVADEVRNLASKSAEASKDTAALIENSIRSVQRGTELADVTSKSLGRVVEGAREVIRVIDQISQASSEQAESIAQVRQGVDQISAVVQTNSATAEESAATSEELSGQAQVLKDLVGRFRLRKQTINQDVDTSYYSDQQSGAENPPYAFAGEADKY